MPKLADDAQTKAAKEAVERDKKVVDRSRAEYAQHAKGKPTPTQEELDLAMCGAHILEHDDDGSGPDPNVRHGDDPEKHMGGAKPASYQTRQSHAKSE